MHGSLASNPKPKQKKEVFLLQTMMAQYDTCDDCEKAKRGKTNAVAKHCTCISCKLRALCYITFGRNTYLTLQKNQKSDLNKPVISDKKRTV